MTTIISLTHPVSKLPTLISNWEEVPSAVKEFLTTCTNIRFDIQEMLVYRASKIVGSCSTFNMEEIEISDCWTSTGNIWS